MSNVNNNQPLDPEARMISDFLLCTIFFGFVFWSIWMIFYFEIGIGESLRLLLEGKNPLLLPFFLMCFATSLFLSAFVFTYFLSKSKNKDKHLRGSKRVD